jgi:hypothetical protein
VDFGADLEEIVEEESGKDTPDHLTFESFVRYPLFNTLDLQID